MKKVWIAIFSLLLVLSIYMALKSESEVESVRTTDPIQDIEALKKETDASKTKKIPMH